MLSRTHRLPRELFDKAFKEGRRVSGPLFMVQSLPVSDGSVRFATVVSKKTAKTAVARNRVRRRTSAALMSLSPSIDKGNHVIFYAKPGSAILSQAEIKTAVSDLLLRARIMR